MLRFSRAHSRSTRRTRHPPPPFTRRVLRRAAAFWVRFSCHNSVSFHRIDLWVADFASRPLPPRAAPPFAHRVLHRAAAKSRTLHKQRHTPLLQNL
jgi:hypothetical protein